MSTVPSFDRDDGRFEAATRHGDWGKMDTHRVTAASQ